MDERRGPSDLVEVGGQFEMAVGPTEGELGVDLLNGAEEEIGEPQARPAEAGGGTRVGDLGREVGEKGIDEAELGELALGVGGPVLCVGGPRSGRRFGGEGEAPNSGVDGEGMLAGAVSGKEVGACARSSIREATHTVRPSRGRGADDEEDRGDGVMAWGRAARRRPR